MSRRNEIGSILALAAIGFAAGAVGAERVVDLNELARCAAISSANERLACYDAIVAVAVPGVRAAANSIQPADAGAQAAVASRPAPIAQPGTSAPTVAAGSGAVGAAVTGASATATAVAGATNPPPASANPDDPANFGLTPHQLKAVPKGPDAIKTVVSTLTEDRQNHVYLLLENGQTWSLLDPDPHVRPGDSVTIKRASLGSFLMMTPSRRSYRVERLN